MTRGRLPIHPATENFPENRQGFRAIQKIARGAAAKGRKLDERRRRKQAQGPRPAPARAAEDTNDSYVAPPPSSFGNMTVSLTPAENIPPELAGVMTIPR